MGETQTAALTEPFGSFPQIIAANAASLGKKIALRDDEGEIDWAELGDRVERIAARLLEDGLSRGQSVAILGYSSIPYALVFLAAVRAGGVAAPLTTSASPDQLAGMGATHLVLQARREATGKPVLRDRQQLDRRRKLAAHQARPPSANRSATVLATLSRT